MENELVTPVQPLSPTPAPTATLSSAMELLSSAWQAYMERFMVLAGITLVPSLLMFASVFIADERNSAAFAIYALVLGLIAVVVQIWSQVALLHAVRGMEEGIGVRTSYARACKTILPYLWICIILAFILMGAYALFIIPGIILSITFAFSLFVLVDEDRKGMDALMRSRQLVKGYWWKVLWRMVFVSFVTFFLVAVIFSFVGFNGLSDVVIGIVSTPIFVTYMYLTYENLKRIKGAETYNPNESRSKMISLGIFGLLIIPALLLFAFGMLEGSI